MKERKNTVQALKTAPYISYVVTYVGCGRGERRSLLHTLSVGL
jgi:hypothetical protein